MNKIVLDKEKNINLNVSEDTTCTIPKENNINDLNINISDGVKLIINQYLVGGRMISMVSLAVYSIVGMIIYFVLSYKIGLVDSIFGKDRIDRYLKKFHLKKS